MDTLGAVGDQFVDGLAVGVDSHFTFVVAQHPPADIEIEAVDLLLGPPDAAEDVVGVDGYAAEGTARKLGFAVRWQKVFQSGTSALMGGKIMIYPKAIAVKPLPDYMLQVDFNNGERRLFDVKPYLRGEWFSELLDEKVFKAVKVEGLSVAWPDGQDIAPDCLYQNAVLMN